MKLFKVFPFLSLLVIVLLSGLPAFAFGYIEPADASLEELLNNGKVEVKILGSGGNQGECIQMQLRNLADTRSMVRVEPGRMLSSMDTSMQDILITREELFALAPGEQKTISLFGFCGQASHASPDSAELFTLGNMADSAVVVLAEFLDEKDNNYPEDAIQRAVWCLTDDHHISEIYSEDLASIADLRNVVASLKGLNAAEIKVEDLPGRQNSFNAYRKSISGEIEIFIPTDCMVDIYVCDQFGKQWESFEKQEAYKAGTYQYSFKMTTTNWPEGKYMLCIRANGILLYEHDFDI